jgi:hypothetical protein
MDSLRNLPVDNNQLSQNEKHSFNKIYPETKTGDDAFNAIYSEKKDTLNSRIAIYWVITT